LDEVVVDQPRVWQAALETAIELMLAMPEFRAQMSEEHIRETPARFVRSFEEYFAGLTEDPEEVLRRGFAKGDYDEMVLVRDIRFASHCGHHLVPFLGKVHFGYLPARRIVGLSKIPRLIEVYARRPQVQEQLASQIVDTFQKVVQPSGCGVVIEALHLCMAVRGVRKETAITRTTALRGSFKKASVKAEFLNAVADSRGGLL
jgi:GTP cyclohydrolase IA